MGRSPLIPFSPSRGDRPHRARLLPPVLAAGLSLALLLLIWLLGQQASPAGADGPSIAGAVLAPDGVSGIPNLSVQLWIGETSSGSPYTSTTTTGIGHYQFNNLNPGVYTLRAWVSAERLDYVSSSRVTVTVQAGQTVTRNLRLAAVDVLGQVRDPSGNPIIGPSQDGNQLARVSIQNADRTVNTGTTANSVGYYKFGGLVTDTYTLWANPPFTGSTSIVSGPAPDADQPALTSDAAGNLHAVWHQAVGANRQIFYAYRPAAGRWSTAVSISPDATQAYTPSIALDASSNPHVLWYDNTLGNYRTMYSTKSASGWSTPRNIAVVTADSRQWTWAGIGADPAGNLHAVWSDDSSGKTEVMYANKPAAGDWSAPLNISNSPAGTNAHSPSLALDASGRVHMVWQRNLGDGTSEVFYAVKTAGGAWSIPLNISNIPGKSQNPSVAVDASGNPHVVWHENVSGVVKVYYTGATAGGLWSTPVAISGDTSASGASIAVDQAGNLYAAWKGTSPSSLWTNLDIWYAQRPRGGDWSTPVNLFRSVSVSADPSIATDAAGNVHVVWPGGVGDRAAILYATPKRGPPLYGPSLQRTITLTPGVSQTVDLTLTVPSITGTVMSPNPQVVTRTNVSLYDDKKTIQRNVSSNDRGQFAFGRLPQGPYWVQASPPGDGRFADYAQSNPRLVQVVSGTVTNAGVFTLTVPSITGTVTLPDGTPQSGAGVSVYNSNHSVSFGVGTDASGRFKVRELPSGDYFVRANPPSGSSYAASLARRVKVTSGATVNAGILQLTTPCVSGRVVDPNGAPVTRTGVSYYSADPANPVREGVGVDQNGLFRIGGLASGDYFVQGNPPSGSPYISSSPVRVTVVATDTTCSAVNVGDLQLRAPGIKGRVVDPDGDPVARAGLSIRKADRSLSTGAGTDENGLFRTSPLPSGDYVVTANPPPGSDLGSSLPITITGVVSGTTKNVGDIPLTLLNLMGRLLLPDGSPAQKGSVHLYSDSRSVDKHVGVDSRGIFRISGLDAGSYWLELDIPWEATGLIAPPRQAVTVVAGQTANVGDISYLRATKHITGQVVKRNPDGSTPPVAGAIVYANKDDGKARASERTDAEGRYTLDIGAGAWLVGVGPDRSPGAPSVDWTYGQPPTGVSFKSDNSEETKTQNFTVVSAGATVRGAIRLPDGTPPALDTVSVGVRDESGFSTGTKLGTDGSFNLRVPGGVYRLGGRSSDPTLSMPVLPPFPVGSTEDKDLGTITLVSKTSRITGRVRDSSGQGISDMGVQAWIKGGGGFVSTRTITDGVYSLMVISGTWEVQARPGPDSDYTITTPPARVAVGNNETQEANFTLLATDATILGKVVDSGLNVVSDFEGYAFAMRENVGAPPTPLGGTQIKGGVFTLNLPAGSNYRIGVSCPPGCKYTVQEEKGLTLSSDETRRLNLTARGADATIAGSVLGGDGNAVQNLRATVRAVNPFGVQRSDLAASGTYTMAVTGGTWNMGLWVDPNSGYVWEPIPLSTTVPSGVTSTVNFTVTRTDSSVSGTVKDPSGSTLDGAWVWAELPRTATSPSRFIRGDTSKDGGKYSLQLPSGRTYNLRATVAEEKGYISPQVVAITITTPSTLTQDLQFRPSDAQIQGVVSLGGSPHSAFVRAWAEKGGRASANAGEDGRYTLSVTKGDRWQVTAVTEVGGELYRSDPAVVDVGSTSPITQNLTLKRVGIVPVAVTLTFDASQMQVINLSDGTQVTIPGGALAVSGTVSVLALPKVSVPAQRGAQPVSLGYDLSATDSDGDAITTFLRNVTVVIKYTDEQLAALGITEDQVVAKYWDSTTSTWKTPDNLVQDKENNTLSISTNHFTVFAGILAGEEATVGQVAYKVYLPFTVKGSSGGW